MTVERLRPGAALAGMALALAGVALESRGLVWAAIGVLVVVFLLRFAGRPSGDSN